MFWALDTDFNLVEATPGAYGVCPACHQLVRAKCGTIYLWHWSHTQSLSSDRWARDCDTWHENESQWHFDWKSRVPQHMREYVIKRDWPNKDGTIQNVLHRADILNSRGTVIELQHSIISPDAIREREAFYENMIWIFDATALKLKLTDMERLHESFRWVWKNPRKWIWDCMKPVFFDFSEKVMNGKTTNHKILRVEKISRMKPCFLTGSFVDTKTFIEMFFR